MRRFEINDDILTPSSLGRPSSQLYYRRAYRLGEEGAERVGEGGGGEGDADAGIVEWEWKWEWEEVKWDARDF